MRLIVGMKRIEGPAPSYDHNYLLASALLQAVSNRSSLASGALHDAPSTSPYVLSEIYPVRSREDEYYFCLNTTLKSLSDLFQDSLRPSSNIRIGRTNLEVRDIRTEAIPPDPPSPMEVSTLSPVLVRDPRNHSRCMVAGDEGYMDALNALVKSKVARFVAPDNRCRVMRVLPDAVRKRRVRDAYVLATKGKFYIEGSPEALSFVLEHGLGANTSMGFGYVVPTGWW